MNPRAVFCFAAAENCSGYRTCGQCLEQPGCGWCTDPSNTGKGQCIEGSYRGPFQTSVPAPSTLPGLPASPQPALNSSMCPSEAKYNWSFIHCPGREEHTCFLFIFSVGAGVNVICHMSGTRGSLLVTSCLGLTCFFTYCSAACQCNGHSQCVNESVCEKCEDLTTGRHCESCISGFYGDPTNGGSCQREYPPASSGQSFVIVSELQLGFFLGRAPRAPGRTVKRSCGILKTQPV